MVGEIAKAKSCAGRMLETAIDDLRRSVTGTGTDEVSQYVLGPSVQDASERDDFAQCRPNITVQIRDHCVDLLLRGCSVGVAAGLDHPSTDASAREDLDVPVDAEDADILEPRRIVAAISATVATVPRGNSGLPTTTSAPRRTRTRKIAPPIPAPAVTTTIRS